jgi:hypothetical protein
LTANNNNLPEWKVSGDWFDVCKCNVPCPDYHGPMTPSGKRVQTINPPGSEVGPGTVATWGTAVTDEVDTMGFKWQWNGKSSKHIAFDWSGP